MVKHNQNMIKSKYMRRVQNIAEMLQKAICVSVLMMCVRS